MNISLLWHSDYCLNEKVFYLKTLRSQDDISLPSSLGGTSYSGSFLLRKLANQYTNELNINLNELYGRLSLSLESLTRPNSLLEDLGIAVTDQDAPRNEKMLYDKFQRRESDPLALRKIFDNELEVIQVI